MLVATLHLTRRQPLYRGATGRILAHSPGLRFFRRDLSVLVATLHLIGRQPLYRGTPGCVLAHSPCLRFFRRDLSVLAATLHLIGPLPLYRRSAGPVLARNGVLRPGHWGRLRLGLTVLDVSGRRGTWRSNEVGTRSFHLTKDRAFVFDYEGEQIGKGQFSVPEALTHSPDALLHVLDPLEFQGIRPFT